MNIEIEPLFTERVDFDTFSKSDLRAVKIVNCEEVPKSSKLLKFTLDDGTSDERIILSGIKEFYSPEELIGRNVIAILNLPPRNMMGMESNGMLLSFECKVDGREVVKLSFISDEVTPGSKLY